MNCPQCGSDSYQPDAECSVCGFTADSTDVNKEVRVPMDPVQRDVMNGVGLGCSVLCFVWFFVESLVFALAIRDRATWSTWGPVVSVGVPLISGSLLYLALRRRTAFSRGVGYSLLITLILAVLFAFIGTRFHDNRPSSNPAHNGFE